MPNWDNGNQEIKTVSMIRLIGDRVDADALIRYSDDDYATYSTYRRHDLNNQYAKLTRLGSTESRAYEIKNTENTALRLSMLEQDFTQGN